MALPLYASIHAANGEPERARESLVASERAFVEQGMPVYAMVMLRRRGQLVGERAGEDMIERADDALALAGVADPARFADQLAPASVWG